MPGAPEPADDGDARQGPQDAPATEPTDWVMEEDGPFFAWLPPEDRLWRHPSEGPSSGPVLELAGDRAARAEGRRLAAVIPLRAFRTTWMVALIAGLVGATAATGVGLASGMWPHDTTVLRSSAPSTTPVSLAAIGPSSTTWTGVDDAVSQSVVTVSVVGVSGPEVGSGMVYLQSAFGYTYVVTDRALFARGQAEGYYGQIDVGFPNGQTGQARLLATDSLSGLAILRVPTPANNTSAPASFGSVGNLGMADSVLAVGSPAAPSAYPGTVSGEDRTVDMADGSDLDGLLALSMSAFSPTAAGGPLVNQYGQVVGLTLSLAPVDPNQQDLTFAVPIDVVSSIATAVINDTTPPHPWLGVTDAVNLPSVTADQLGLIGGVRAGLVSASGPAALAGVRPNDIITSIDGKASYSTGALIAEVSECAPGASVPMTFMRGDRTVRTTVRIGSEPTDS